MWGVLLRERALYILTVGNLKIGVIVDKDIGEEKSKEEEEETSLEKTSIKDENFSSEKSESSENSPTLLPSDSSLVNVENIENSGERNDKYVREEREWGKLVS